MAMTRAALRKRMVVVQRESDAEESSEEEEEEEVEEEEFVDSDYEEPKEEEDEEAGVGEDEEGGDDHEEEGEEEEEEKRQKKKKGRITISLKGQKVCKVCKAKDHQAGFVGSVYLDCPNKPCYLCKQPGHTTLTCPHRMATEHGVVAAPRRRALGLLDFVNERQLRNHLPTVQLPQVIPNKVDSAIIRLHSRRVTHLEFHPTKDNILISGDKRGQVGIWDFEKVFNKTVHENIHSCLVNNIKFHPWQDGMMYTASSDGKVCFTDLESGTSNEVLDLNPDGWAGPSTWRMIHAMDLNNRRELALAADNFGFLYQVDTRANKEVGKPTAVHKKGTKVVGVHCHPIDPDLFITCGNDHMARIWDMRMLGTDNCLAVLSHPRVVTSAYFSPVTGNKIMSTCIDNRIRVWDNICADLSEPSREIVHSHNFNRYITAFKAEWDPKDRSECLTVIGRYISDDFNGVALHPIDFIDVSNGRLVEQVYDHSITTICTVNKLHPRLDCMATGSSRSLFLWRPKDNGDDAFEDEDATTETKKTTKIQVYEADGGKAGRAKGKKNDDDDDDFAFLKKKAAAKANGAGPSCTAKESSKQKLNVEDEDSSPPKEKNKRKGNVEDEDSSPPKEKSKRKGNAEDEDSSPPKEKNKRKGNAEDEDSSPPKEKNKRKGNTEDEDSSPPKEKNKRKSIAEDDDSSPSCTVKEKSKRKSNAKDDNSDDDFEPISFKGKEPAPPSKGRQLRRRS